MNGDTRSGDGSLKTSVGTILLWAGGAVAGFGGILLATNAWVNLPPAVVVVIAKALPFVVGGAFMAVGAVIRRHALRRRSQDPASPALDRPSSAPWSEPAPRQRAPVIDPDR